MWGRLRLGEMLCVSYHNKKCYFDNVLVTKCLQEGYPIRAIALIGEHWRMEI